MDMLEIFQRLGTAIAIGALVGVERHWRERNDKAGQRTAGLRTFSLIGMFGGVAGLIAETILREQMAMAVFLTGVFVAFAAVFAAFSYREAVSQGGHSVTTTVVAMLTFALGLLAVKGDLTLASAAGVTMVGILAAREALHAFVRRLSWVELRSAVVLLGMTFVVLPLLPVGPVGPFGGISPARIWLLAVVLAGISFCGYVSVRLLGSARGELVAGAVAGIVSSTAATLANARRAKAGGEPRTLAAGALGACAVSYLRTAVLLTWLAAPVAARLVPALVAAGLAVALSAFVFARHDCADHVAQETKNPFDLDGVLKMAALLAGVAFVTRVAADWFGDAGVVTVSAISGLVDVDASIVAVGGMLDGVTASAATAAIAAAVLANTGAKTAYALIAGGAAFGLRFAAASVAAGCIAIAAYAIQITALE